jgi:predicted membrane protein|tara:strand:- start:1411 stop:1665 length:255 start_codon:yes stop_codon:yes gene_type:complete
MAKAKKITKEELEKVNELAGTANNLAMQLGSLDIQKSVLIEQFKSNNLLIEKQKEELQEKYGDITIDLKDGSIKEVEEVKKDGE